MESHFDTTVPVDGEKALDEAIVRLKHLMDYPHRLKSYRIASLIPESLGGPSYSWTQMNCGRKGCHLPAIDPEYFTLNES